MGLEIDRIDFDAEDFLRFRERLHDNLDVLAQLLRRPGFGEGEASFGAELEMYIVDQRGHPLPINQEVLAAADDPTLTLELNRYNLEYNLPAFGVRERPFFATERAMLDSLSRLRAVAQRWDGRIVPIGILPTLRETDFGADCITDRRRYHALVRQLIRQRGDSFQIEIGGAEPLRIEMNDITLEGANTSFQVHYRVSPAVYADTFNAVQLATPLALAIGANSPTLFGHRLWQETRIPLFKQSIDTRHLDPYACHQPPRVGFGLGWVRDGAEELFRETVSVYEPLLPICAEETAAQQLAAGRIPGLAEMRLHQSTVWLWNRPIYDDASGGHLRIEMRALPAGPTAVDMAANAAFLIGLAEGLRPQLAQLLPAMPFHYAQYNFYRAAQFGLDAQLVWPGEGGSRARELPVDELLAKLLPVAADGLAAIGIDGEEIAHYLGIIEERLARRQSGAIWQQKTLDSLALQMDADRARHAMLERFIEYSTENLPVARWPL
ncbi:glutamate--cysteine ligase [Mangrovimicrobium sediminis]|uniref:Glutamate--cysteine ligase n=1 Tax=Mangrovimicrobium sediminis TaxID=2562682 RepID=A0A4Z0M8K0_9GAMM|nr:glutamate--cysteine ligase [Haliea sp. SAOS-164]TGD76033.1 glutamate--cysteine ligase [Haliea sp. SAOS-164]